MVIHGPVYDDTFLGAALFWLVAAIALSRWVTARLPRNGARSNVSWIVTAALVILSGWAAVTRTEALVAVVGIAVGCLAIPGLRVLRSTGLAIAFGVILAVGAWGERNAIVQHHFMTGSSHDGVTLWESTEPNAMRALALGQVNALSADSSIIGAIWQQAAGKDEVGANQVFVHAAMQEMRDDPIRVAAFGVRKIGISIAGVRPELPIGTARNLVSILSTWCWSASPQQAPRASHAWLASAIRYDISLVWAPAYWRWNSSACWRSVPSASVTGSFGGPCSGYSRVWRWSRPRGPGDR